MQGEELLDKWHAAKKAHQRAAEDEKNDRLAAALAAESDAARYFGLGAHLKSLQRPLSR